MRTLDRQSALVSIPPETKKPTLGRSVLPSFRLSFHAARVASRASRLAHPVTETMMVIPVAYLVRMGLRRSGYQGRKGSGSNQTHKQQGFCFLHLASPVLDRGDRCRDDCLRRSCMRNPLSQKKRQTRGSRRSRPSEVPRCHGVARSMLG